MTKNVLFPGRPAYEGPKAGIFGLLHHEILCESSRDVMEWVEYVKKYKPAHEVEIRLRNMIYLGGCETVATRVAIQADYEAKRRPLDADYEAKRRPLDAEIRDYIFLHIPDCPWNGETLVSP